MYMIGMINDDDEHMILEDEWSLNFVAFLLQFRENLNQEIDLTWNRTRAHWMRRNYVTSRPQRWWQLNENFWEFKVGLKFNISEANGWNLNYKPVVKVYIPQWLTTVIINEIKENCPLYPGDDVVSRLRDPPDARLKVTCRVIVWGQTLAIVLY